MKNLFALLIGTALSVGAADTVVSVYYPTSLETTGCSRSRTDGQTTFCATYQANNLNGSRGVSLVDTFSYATYGWRAFGANGVTQATSGLAVRATQQVAYATEFAGNGSNITVHNYCDFTNQNCQDVDVYVDRGSGETLVDTLDSGTNNVVVTYSAGTFSIILRSEHTTAGAGDDWVADWDIDIHN